MQLESFVNILMMMTRSRWRWCLHRQVEMVQARRACIHTVSSWSCSIIKGFRCSKRDWYHMPSRGFSWRGGKTLLSLALKFKSCFGYQFCMRLPWKTITWIAGGSYPTDPARPATFLLLAGPLREGCEMSKLYDSCCCCTTPRWYSSMLTKFNT